MPLQTRTQRVCAAAFLTIAAASTLLIADRHKVLPAPRYHKMAAAGRPRYRLVRLDTPPGSFVTEAHLTGGGIVCGLLGHKVGEGENPGVCPAFIWKAGKLTVLPMPKGSEYCTAYDASADGETVVGEADSPVIGGAPNEFASAAIVWRRGKIASLPPLPQKPNATARYIDARGEIAGWCTDEEMPDSKELCVWRGGKVEDIGAGKLLSFSAAGAAYVQDESSDKILSISARGRDDAAPDSRGHGAFASRVGTSLVADSWSPGQVSYRLTFPDQSIQDALTHLTATGVNSEGVIVGSSLNPDAKAERAMLWNGAEYDLNRCLVNAPSKHPILWVGEEIDDNGWIIARINPTVEPRQFGDDVLLKPV